MPNPALPTMPVNDYLTRKLLRKMAGTGTPLTALLEQLITDDVYALNDDFDKGLNANLWELYNMEVGDDFLYSDQPDDADNDTPSNQQGYWVISVSDRWELGKRPVMQARVNFGLTTTLQHFEFGFVANPTEGRVVTDINVLGGGSTVTPQRSVASNSFALAVRDNSFAAASQFYVVSGGPVPGASTPSTQLQVDATATTPTPDLVGEMTLMVAANEQGETRLWVNGQHDNSFSEEADIVPGAPCHLWVMGESGSLSIDYIQAWRERTLL